MSAARDGKRQEIAKKPTGYLRSLKEQTAKEQPDITVDTSPANTSGRDLVVKFIREHGLSAQVAPPIG